jgi:SAM-dependent methyltransferase
LVHADLLDVAFPPAAFDAVTSFYAIAHLPRERHGELFGRIAGWLRPGGRFLASLGAGGAADWTGEWLGVPMFFSSHDRATNRALLESAGFQLLRDEVVAMREPEGEVSFQWVVAEKRAQGGPGHDG